MTPCNNYAVSYLLSWSTRNSCVSYPCECWKSTSIFNYTQSFEDYQKKILKRHLYVIASVQHVVLVYNKSTTVTQFHRIMSLYCQYHYSIIGCVKFNSLIANIYTANSFYVTCFTLSLGRGKECL
jgi:hypothetical protein